jgi:hypothetical protein
MNRTVEDLKALRDVLLEKRRAVAYLIVPGQQPDRVASIADFHLAIDAVEAIEEGLDEDGADTATKVPEQPAGPRKLNRRAMWELRRDEPC